LFVRRKVELHWRMDTHRLMRENSVVIFASVWYLDFDFI
jgi:hypothetical protein